MIVTQLRTDDSAVSPVLGVILMVAVTVILAAVVATYAFGMTAEEPAPTASFSSEYEETANVLTLTHASGDPIPADSLSVRGDLGTCAPMVVCSGQETLSETGSYGSGSTVRSGQQFLVQTDGDDFRITVVYDDGEQTAQLGTFTGPDA